MRDKEWVKDIFAYPYHRMSSGNESFYTLWYIGYDRKGMWKIDRFLTAVCNST